jgi:hypothetical protein
MPAYLTSFSATNEAAMLLLAASRGDIAVRSDQGRVWQLWGGATNLADWTPNAGLASLVAATNQDRQAALVAASDDIDALPLQGSKLAADQEREFPRVDGGPSAWPAGSTRAAGYGAWPGGGGGVVWDLDAEGNAIVPRQVLVAAVAQADSLLAGDRSGRIQAIRDQLASQSIGSASESYRSDADPESISPLVERAERLMGRYRLRTGTVE